MSAGVARVRATISAMVEPANLERQANEATWPLERLQRERDEQLRRLLSYAKEHSPWHAKRLVDVDPDTATGEDLSAIPPMTKADLMANWDEIVTVPGLTLARADEHLDRMLAEGPSLLDDRYLVMATGGTTGRRGVIVEDVDEAFGRERMAKLRRRSAWRGRHLGVTDGRATRRASITAARPVHASYVGTWLQGSASGDRRHLSPLQPLDEIVASLNSHQPTTMVVYPSVAHRLAVEAAEGRLHIEPVSIMCQSEPLLPETRSALEAAFPTAIIQETYSSTESPIADWNPVHSGMHLIEELLVFEPVDEHNAPVPAGTPSRKVLVTNLFNKALPLIRYELTDSVTMDPAANPGPFAGRRILAVEGRSDDWFSYPDGGRVVEVHPHLFRSALAAERAITGYQVRQTSRGASIVVEAAGAVDCRSLSCQIGGDLEALGLSSPVVSVEVVAELPRHSETAKLRRFVPLSS